MTRTLSRDSVPEKPKTPSIEPEEILGRIEQTKPFKDTGEKKFGPEEGIVMPEPDDKIADVD